MILRPEALAAWLAALQIDTWAPLTAAERDLVRRCLAPAPQPQGCATDEVVQQGPARPG